MTCTTSNEVSWGPLLGKIDVNVGDSLNITVDFSPKVSGYSYL